MSSDGCGSLPNFDDKGNLVKLDSGEPKSIFIELMDLVEKEKFPLEKALKVVTSNIADILKLSNKGRIAKGKDADVVLLDKENRVVHLAANGSLMVKDAQKIKVGHLE
jgi:beta-aspartyl-dipeptidase (metallo-type)